MGVREDKVTGDSGRRWVNALARWGKDHRPSNANKQPLEAGKDEEENRCWRLWKETCHYHDVSPVKLTPDFGPLKCEIINPCCASL